MKHIWYALITLTTLTTLTTISSAVAQQSTEPKVDMSLRLEAFSAIDRAVSFLLIQQNPNGSFSDHPGITAMTAFALVQSPQQKNKEVKAALAKARTYILSQINADGGVSQSKLRQDVYSTSVCLLALAAMKDPADKPAIITLRKWLIKTQIKKTGGFAYGGSTAAVDTSYPDLSNTHWALEALTLTGIAQVEDKELLRQHNNLKHKLANFISTCQINKADAGTMSGGFLYYPVDKQPKKSAYKDTDKVWGSLTMGALKSLLFSGVEPNDPRIVNGLKWNSQNYTMAKNPGLDQGGWFYYTYMASSAMWYLKQHTIVTPDKKAHNWRTELLEELLSRQKSGDHWENSNRLWMESDANLCTAYAINAAMVALEEVK